MADQKLSDIRHAFLNATFGPPSIVIHTQAAEAPPMDLAIWAPQARNKPYVTIATDGLSEQLLAHEKAPQGWACERAEIVMYLPQLVLDPQKQQIPWELAFLRMVSDLPSRAQIPLHAFFVIANGDPPNPFIPGSLQTHAILLPPAHESVEFRDGFDAPDGTSVEYLWLDFLTAPEAHTLRDHGNVRLLEFLASKGHAPPTVFNRSCLATGQEAPPLPPAPASETPPTPDAPPSTGTPPSA